MKTVTLRGKALRGWSKGLSEEQIKALSTAGLQLEGETPEISFLWSEGWVDDYLEEGLCPALDGIDVEVDGTLVHTITWDEVKPQLSADVEIQGEFVKPRAMALRSISNGAEWVAQIEGEFSSDKLRIEYDWVKFPDSHPNWHGTIVPVISEIYYDDVVDFEFNGSGHLEQIVVFSDESGVPRNVYFREPDLSDAEWLYLFSLSVIPEEIEGGISDKTATMVRLSGTSIRAIYRHLSPDECQKIAGEGLFLEGFSENISILWEEGWIEGFLYEGLSPALSSVTVEVNGVEVQAITWEEAKKSFSTCEKVRDELIQENTFTVRQITTEAFWEAEVEGEVLPDNLKLEFEWVKIPDGNPDVHGTIIPLLRGVYLDGQKLRGYYDNDFGDFIGDAFFVDGGGNQSDVEFEVEGGEDGNFYFKFKTSND